MEIETTRGPGGLVVEALGAGPPIVCVHGRGGESGAEAWRAQWPLAERWRLICPHRPGYGGSPRAGREDFAEDAALIAELLGGGAHLVGHAYGGIVAVLAAALRPRAVWSLLAIEPPASRAALGDPDVDAYERALRASADHETHNYRPPWEAELPLGVLMAATFPKLFVTGGHNPAFEAIGDSLALQLGGDRLLLTGASHAPHTLGARLNAVLEAFMRAKPLPKDDPAEKRGAGG